MNRRRPNILLLADLIPWPLQSGGQIKSYRTLRALAEIGDVTLVTFVRRPEDEAYLQELKPFCDPYGFPLHRAGWRDAAAGAWSLLTSSSFFMNRNAHSALQSFVNRLIAVNYADDAEDSADKIDIIHIDHLQMMQFVPLDIPACKIVLDCHNVEYDLIRQMGQATGDWADLYLRPLYRLESLRLKEVERDACLRADAVLAVTEEDAMKFRALAPEIAERVRCAPIGVDTEYFQLPDCYPMDSRTLLFMGAMFWPPNVDALRWFCDSILPRLQHYIPDVRLMVVGARPTQDVRDIALATPGIELIADTPDIRPYAARASAFIAPLRFGGGMPVKTLCAMAMGLPVIATPSGVAGIYATDDEEIVMKAKNSISPCFALVESDADRFAAAVAAVLTNAELAAELAENGRELVCASYSATVAEARVKEIYGELIL